MPKVLLAVPHRLQQNDGDCLAACAAMALEYLGRAIDYPRLLNLLKIAPHGAPASNIRRLEALGVKVVFSKTDVVGLETMLNQGQPVVVFVRTGELPYWTYATDHALLVVGYDDSHVYVNDPNEPDVPIAVPRGDFELAWQERDYSFAQILP